MSWLDGMTGCTGDCNVSASSVTWRDIELNTIRDARDPPVVEGFAYLDDFLG